MILIAGCHCVSICLLGIMSCFLVLALHTGDHRQQTKCPCQVKAIVSQCMILKCLLAERFARIEIIGDVARDGQPHGDFIRRLPIRVTG